MTFPENQQGLTCRARFEHFVRPSYPFQIRVNFLGRMLDTNQPDSVEASLVTDVGSAPNYETKIPSD